MNRLKVASDLVKIAKELTAGETYMKFDARNIESQNKSAPSTKSLQDSALDFLEKTGMIYVVLNIILKDRTPMFRISGISGAVSDWLKNGFKNDTIEMWDIYAVTTDRNVARRLGEEV